MEIYVEIDEQLRSVMIPSLFYLELPAWVVHAGSEKMQPDRLYVLGSKTPMSEAQKVAVKLAAEVLDYHDEE